jgi:hypothetical protein
VGREISEEDREVKDPRAYIALEIAALLANETSLSASGVTSKAASTARQIMEILGQAGFAIVPREPTAAMIEAGDGYEWATEVWDAMIAENQKETSK